MVPAELRASYQAALDHHRAAVDSLVPLVIEMAFSTLRDVLPAAHVLETKSDFTEDWLHTLRIIRVLDESATPIFDVDDGHPEPEVEDVVDLVGVDYLDRLFELTGDQYSGHAHIANPGG